MTKDRRNPLNIVEAIYDPQLFGSLFKTVSSWSAWVVFLKAVFGIAIDFRWLLRVNGQAKRKEQSTNGRENDL
jgi:hypothetical protein